MIEVSIQPEWVIFFSLDACEKAMYKCLIPINFFHYYNNRKMQKNCCECFKINRKLKVNDNQRKMEKMNLFLSAFIHLPTGKNIYKVYILTNRIITIVVF